MAWCRGPGSMDADQHTFVFADLAGFTALTEAHGDEHAADIALEFCDELNARLPEDAEDLKMLGDACLLRIGDAGEAIEFGLRLTGEVAQRHGFPDVRVGMHTGTAARRGADWFGSTINMAARVAALAAPGEVLLTAATCEAAGSRADADLEDFGVHELRHVALPVRVFRANAADMVQPDARWAIDPVCQMRLDIGRAHASVEFGARAYFFCSPVCVERFGHARERYLRDSRVQ